MQDDEEHQVFIRGTNAMILTRGDDHQGVRTKQRFYLIAACKISMALQHNDVHRRMGRVVFSYHLTRSQRKQKGAARCINMQRLGVWRGLVETDVIKYLNRFHVSFHDSL